MYKRWRISFLRCCILEICFRAVRAGCNKQGGDSLSHNVRERAQDTVHASWGGRSTCAIRQVHCPHGDGRSWNWSARDEKAHGVAYVMGIYRRVVEFGTSLKWRRMSTSPHIDKDWGTRGEGERRRRVCWITWGEIEKQRRARNVTVAQGGCRVQATRVLMAYIVDGSTSIT